MVQLFPDQPDQFWHLCVMLFVDIISQYDVERGEGEVDILLTSLNAYQKT